MFNSCIEWLKSLLTRSPFFSWITQTRLKSFIIPSVGSNFTYYGIEYTFLKWSRYSIFFPPNWSRFRTRALKRRICSIDRFVCTTDAFEVAMDAIPAPKAVGRLTRLLFVLVFVLFSYHYYRAIIAMLCLCLPLASHRISQIFSRQTNPFRGEQWPKIVFDVRPMMAKIDLNPLRRLGRWLRLCERKN